MGKLDKMSSSPKSLGFWGMKGIIVVKMSCWAMRHEQATL